jgi:hypothetical protein
MSDKCPIKWIDFSHNLEDFSGLYKLSNTGEIKSVKTGKILKHRDFKFTLFKNGKRFNVNSKRLLLIFRKCF